MNLADYSKRACKAIDAEVVKRLESFNSETPYPQITYLLNQFISASEGGKRLRGILVKMGYELGSKGKQNKEIFLPAAAFEIFHTAILAQDDIIDKSILRRGKSTLYKALGGDHHAISQTICLSDLGFFISNQLIIDSHFPDNLKNKALQIFNNTMLETVVGEMLDIELPLTKLSVNEEDILSVYRLKTARYTFVGPLQVGAILAKADKKTLKAIEIFGESLGIAFQIQDDILGVFGDEIELGKSVVSDIEEGKMTLLYLHAYKRADKAQKEYLDMYYGTSKIDQSILDNIRRIFIDTKSLEYAKIQSEKYTSVAYDQIVKMTSDKTMRGLLKQLAAFLLNRTK